MYKPHAVAIPNDNNKPLTFDHNIHGFLHGVTIIIIIDTSQYTGTPLPLNLIFHTIASVMTTIITTAKITAMIVITAITHKRKLSPVATDGTVRGHYDYGLSTSTH